MDFSQLEEIYSNTSGAVYQCDQSRRFYVDFEGKKAKYDVKTLFQLRNKLNNFSIEEIFSVNTLNPSGIEIITLSTTNYCYILNPLQIIRFRELLDDAFAMLQLNQIIRDTLYYAIPA